MKAYKGFNKDMTCRGFQFEEWEEYHEDKVAEIPAADVQPVKRGSWIWKERHRNSLYIKKGRNKYGEETDIQTHDEYVEKVNYCSECGKLGHEVFLNYCPNCGAKMDGEDNE